MLEALHITANIFTTVGDIDAKLTARELKPEMTIIARAETEATERRLMLAGASRAICLPIIGALKVNRMLMYPAMEDLLEATHERDIVVDHLNVSDTPEFVGRSLRDLALPSIHGVIVLAVDSADGDRRFNPPADHTLAAGEKVIVVGSGDALEQLESVGRS